MSPAKIGQFFDGRKNCMKMIAIVLEMVTFTVGGDEAVKDSNCLRGLHVQFLTQGKPTRVQAVAHEVVHGRARK